jgi:hypothetical protein
MRPEDLPHVSLQELLNGGYVPVSVSDEAGREYVVVAPRPDAYAQPPLPGLGPSDHSLAGPGTGIPGSEDSVRQFREDRGDIQLSAPLRSVASGIAHRGRPQSSGGTIIGGPNPVAFDSPPSARLGIGAETGEIRPHPRVDLAQGVGAGLGSPIGGIGNELGSAVPSPFTSWVRREYNKDLYGIKGLRMYDKMRKSDGTVRGTLRLAKTPVLAGQWSMTPASNSDKDKMIADFVWRNLTKWMSTSWPQMLTETLLMLDFGYYMFEKVFVPGEQITNDPMARGKICWKKMAPRHPMDVKEWFFDFEGGPMSVDMWGSPAQMAGLQGGIYQGFGQWTNIPINKLLVFSFDKEAGNIEGISLLRSAYKHWYYKDNLYKIDAIQKERHGIGVPVIQLPAGYSPQDLTLADNLGRNLRTNDRAHVVLPPNWILTFAELKGQPVNVIQSIEHHDNEIEKQILGQFLGQNQKQDEESHTLFLKATRFTADIVTDVVNSYGIPQLVDMNWIGVGYPTLTVKRIGEQEDWRTASFTIRNYVGAGVIVPDQPLEDALRAELGLPPSDPETSRLANTPFNKNDAQQPPIELPGNAEDLKAALDDGSITIQQLQQAMGQGQSGQQQGAQAGGPRQTPPGATNPSTGQGDGSGNSGRRGQ